MNRRDFNLNALKLVGSGALAAWMGAGRSVVVDAENGDPRLRGAYRFSRGRWIYVHLEGTPAEIGFQHGHLLAPEIEDAFKSVVLTNLRGTGKSRAFFRRASREMLWPKVDAEYQAEVEGIYHGLRARGAKMDLDDVIWLNAMEELSDYYVPWYDERHKTATNKRPVSPGNCSAFVATSSYTKGGQIVMAHSLWTSYLHGDRWNIIFDIVPKGGHRILMDGFPGVITSDDDFGINSAGIMITETTITQFRGWNPDGIPEFVRARKAMQYASSIDDYVRIMLNGDNGGYANDWLLGDRKTGEIARFELGLKDHRVWRTKDGYYVGSNFASDPKLIADETTFDPHDLSSSPNARRVRAEQLMKEWKGRIDVDLGQKYLADHYDTWEKREHPCTRTLCGHGDVSRHGEKVWDWKPFNPGGAVTGKVTDSTMTAAMSFVGRRGHPCGENFYASPFLKKHPEFSWQSPLLHDMIAGPWTVFKSGEKA